MICLVLSIYLLVKVIRQEQTIKDLYNFNIALSCQLDDMQKKARRKKRVKNV